MMLRIRLMPRLAVIVRVLLFRPCVYAVCCSSESERERRSVSQSVRVNEGDVKE